MNVYDSLDNSIVLLVFNEMDMRIKVEIKSANTSNREFGTTFWTCLVFGSGSREAKWISITF
jgi:hypothetical protein